MEFTKSLIDKHIYKITISHNVKWLYRTVYDCITTYKFSTRSNKCVRVTIRAHFWHHEIELVSKIVSANVLGTDWIDS